MTFRVPSLFLPLLSLAFLPVLSGCATSRVYENGINHMYLCSVRVVRAHGYQVREQDFSPASGTLIAARSTPDPKATVISRGFFRRTKEVLWNAWEHGKFEFWDEEDDSARVRTDERIVIKFRQGSGMWGWLTHTPRSTTKVTVSADVTEYGREDWVIKRDEKPSAVRDAIYASIKECVGAPSPSVYTAKVKAATPAAMHPAGSPTGAGGAPPSSATAATLAASPPATATVATVAEGILEHAVPPDAGTSRPVAAPAPAGAGTSRPEAAPAADPPAVLTEARKLYEAGKYAAAVPLLASVVAAEPDNAEALGYLGASYYQLKQLDDAIAAYEAYVRLVPADGRTAEFIEEMKKERGGAGGR